MNSFLKGFLSIFDWMFPKTLEQSMEDLDNRMQDLYDRMGWGQYKNPLNKSWNTVTANDIIQETYMIDNNKITMTTSKNLLENMNKNYDN